MIEPLPPYIELTTDQKEALTELVFGPPSKPEPADVGFIFGGTHPGIWNTAISLFREQKLSRFIVTGNTGGSGIHHPAWTHSPSTPESRAIAEHLTNAGIPESSLVIEDQSTNSLENVLFAMNQVDFRQFASVLAITKSYATGRQIRTLARYLPSGTTVYSVSFPAEGYKIGAGTIDRHNWTETEPRVRLVLGQYRRIMKYGALDHIVPADPVPGVPYEGF
jgi:uncharacterized SAM-binding protein YcdF (DUF218 family)